MLDPALDPNASIDSSFLPAAPRRVLMDEFTTQNKKNSPLCLRLLVLKYFLISSKVKVLREFSA